MSEENNNYNDPNTYQQPTGQNPYQANNQYQSPPPNGNTQYGESNAQNQYYNEPPKNNNKWYFERWFLCLLFVFWQSIIPAIIGVVLLSLYYTNRKNTALQKQEEEKRSSQMLEGIKRNIDHLNRERDDLQSELDILTEKVLIASTQIDSYDNLRSDEVKNNLQILKISQNEMIKDETAFDILDTGKTKREINAQKKQIMRCYNAETVNIIASVTFKNVDNSRSKLQRCYEAINKMFVSDGVAISQKYHATKLEELSMVYAYMVKQEEEKLLQAEIREQLKEEEKVRREIEREKSKIDKEEKQFSAEVKRLMSYMQKANDEIEKRLYIEKITELEDKLKLLEKDKEDVLNRELNTRAGYVYVISNIGSLGENIYKIGMTRRLEPMDRIRELSNASVPFGFDVHAMIFSEDAPALETTLHNTFQANQVNKVNHRKEFFNVELTKIKEVVLESFNSSVQFIDIPDAVEYRETLRISDEKLEKGA